MRVSNGAEIDQHIDKLTVFATSQEPLKRVDKSIILSNLST